MVYAPKPPQSRAAPDLVNPFEAVVAMAFGFALGFEFGVIKGTFTILYLVGVYFSTKRLLWEPPAGFTHDLTTAILIILWPVAIPLCLIFRRR